MLQHGNEVQNQILDQIYGQGCFNTLDNRKEGKHSFFSLELLEEKVCYRILTPTPPPKKKTKTKRQPMVSFTLLHIRSSSYLI